MNDSKLYECAPAISPPQSTPLDFEESMSIVNKRHSVNIWPSYVNGGSETTTTPEYFSNPDDEEHSESFSYTWTIECVSQYFGEDYHGPETIYSENFPKYNFQKDYSNQLAVKFYLELVPDGEDEDCQDYISAFLYLSGCTKTDVILKYKFWIINKNGEKCNYEGI